MTLSARREAQRLRAGNHAAPATASRQQYATRAATKKLTRRHPPPPFLLQRAENQYVILYSFIELRAKLRAAEDMKALTLDNIRRILQVANLYLVESKHGQETSLAELKVLAGHIAKVLRYYQGEVYDWHKKLREKYERALKSAKALVSMAGGFENFKRFVDRLIDVDALDIDLNGEASKLEFPPTMTEEMIVNVEQSWIPATVLKSLEEDRRLLIAVRRHVIELVGVDEAEEVEAAAAAEEVEVGKQDADIPARIDNLLDFICRHL